MPPPADPAAPSISAPPVPTPFEHAVRLAFAAVLSLFVSEVLHLSYANLAVWTTHMVMVKYDYTVFQKGFERLLGRFLGIAVGWVLLALFPDAWSIRLYVETLLVVVFFYLYFAGRLAYTFLNTGILTITILAIGEKEPAQAYVVGREFLVAIAVGIAAADLVMWLTTRERSLSIQTGLEPLFPVRIDWLNHSAMLTASAFAVWELTKWLEFPSFQAVNSVFLIAITPNIQEGLRKGELRLLGALLALAWGGLTFLVIVLVPYFLVFMGLIFFGMLLAAYLARASDSYSYAGLQMGLVLPMLVVVPLNEFGDVEAVFFRIEGIICAIGCTLVIGAIWPPFYRTAEPAPAPAQR